MLGVDLDRRQLAGSERHAPAAVLATPFDDVLDRRRLPQRLVDRLAHRHARAAAVRPVGRDHDLRAGVLQPLHDRRPRRSRRRSAPAPRRGGRTRARRPPPPATSAGRRRPGRPARRRAPASASASAHGLARQLAQVQTARSPSSPAKIARDLVRALARPAVEAGVGDVQPRALEPRRPFDPARVVEHPVPRCGRAGGRGRRRRRARNGPARRGRRGGRRRSPRSRALRASRVTFAASSCSGEGVHAKPTSALVATAPVCQNDPRKQIAPGCGSGGDPIRQAATLSATPAGRDSAAQSRPTVAAVAFSGGAPLHVAGLGVGLCN